jgi:hypothetical protein
VGNLDSWVFLCGAAAGNVQGCATAADADAVGTVAVGGAVGADIARGSADAELIATGFMGGRGVEESLLVMMGWLLFSGWCIETRCLIPFLVGNICRRMFGSELVGGDEGLPICCPAAAGWELFIFFLILLFFILFFFLQIFSNLLHTL